MIINQLYPTTVSWGVGATTDQYTDEHTAALITLDTVSTDSYYLGWAEYDDLPTFMGHCTGELDGDILTITEDVNESRVPCGYTFVGQNSTTDYQRGTFLKDGVWTGNQYGYNQAYLMNQVHPEYYANTVGEYIGGHIVLYFLAVVYDAGNNVVYQNGYGLQYHDYSTFFPFIHGDSTIYANDIDGYGTFELSADMFAEGTEMVTLVDPVTHEATGYTARLFMVGYSIPTKYYRSNGGTTDMVNAAFFAKMSAGEHEYCINALGNAGTDWNLGWYGSSIGYIDMNGNYTHYENFAGVSGTVNISQIRNNELAFTWDGGVLAVCGSQRENYPIGVFALCSIEDVRKSIDSHFRICPGNYVDSYVLNQSYATDVTEEDQFLLRLKTGNITNPTFKDTLREWQYSDLQSDEFTEEDIPEPPEPPEPDPGGDPDDDPEEEDAPDKQDWGDPMNPNNGFSVPYAFANYAAFNADGIQNFANRLWDAPDSFWEALTILNKNNANWLDYFISLRAYPYWINSTGEMANIYVGAGGQFYLGDEGTNLYASSPQHITYFTLSFNVPKYYNNFLDFNPYTKAYIYLPFSGTWEVNPKYLYHTTIIISLKLDITDGSGVWQVFRSGMEGAGPNYVILQKQCKVGVDLPLSGLNATSMSSNIVNATLGNFERTASTATKIGGILAGGLAGAALGGPIGAAIGMTAGATMTGLENSVDTANANREQVSVSGGMAGLAAANCNVVPSITLIRPIAQNPDTFAHTVGNLVNKSATISSISGFTTCRNVDCSSISQAIDKEKAMIKKIMENGFYA